MKTRMTELFGLRYPIMLAGMNWLTTPRLVAAVSNAGGLGVLGCAHYNREELRANIRKIRELTDKPFGVNVTLWQPKTQGLVPVILEEKVPVVNYSLGRPPEVTALIKAVHGYGGKIIGTVALSRHAVRAEQLGADLLNITGYEAAAHSGNVGAIVLIPTIAGAVKIPCIAAGGFCDGKGLAAALALGAEGIAMGTRLAATQEAEVPEAVKQAWVKATEEDTVIDPAFDGINCRVLRNKAAEDLMKKRIPVLDALWAALRLKQTLKLSYAELMRSARNLKKNEQRSLASVMRFAVGAELFVKATGEGDLVSGILMCGQGVGRIHDIPTVAAVMERTIVEAEQAMNQLKAKVEAK